MDLRISLLSFNFVMIHIIHKILVWIKNRLNYVKDIFLNSFLRSIIGFLKKLTFFIVCNDVKSKEWRKKKLKI